MPETKKASEREKHDIEELQILDLQRKFGVGYATACNLLAFITAREQSLKQELEASNKVIERQIKQAICYCSDVEKLKQEHDRALDALALILPLAKGYVANNRVGSNEEYIKVAEETINRLRGKEGV